MAAPKFSVGQVVRGYIGSWEDEDLVVQGPIIHCERREDRSCHPDDYFSYQVKDERFQIRESLLIPV